jgi:hypothetical protein
VDFGEAHEKVTRGVLGFIELGRPNHCDDGVRGSCELLEVVIEIVREQIGERGSWLAGTCICRVIGVLAPATPGPTDSPLPESENACLPQLQPLWGNRPRAKQPSNRIREKTSVPLCVLQY